MTTIAKTLEIQAEGYEVAHRVARNSFFLLLSTILGIITRLAMIPVIARYLGVDLFGFYALIMAISMSITPIANFGVERIVCRELSKNKFDGEIYFGTTVIVKSVLSLLLFFLAIPLILWFTPWNRAVEFALIIAITEQLFFSMGQTYIAAVRAFERMEFDIYANSVHKISLFVLVLIAVILDLGFTSIFWARLASSTIFLLASIIFSYSFFLEPKFSFNSEYAKHIIKESFPVAIYSLLLALIFKVDVFLLEWFGNQRDVALFEGPHRLASQMQILATSISFAIFPVLSRISNNNLNHSLQQYYRETYKLLFISGVLLAALLFLGGKSLITAIFGNEFTESAVSLQILSPIVVFLFIVILQTSFLIAINKQTLNLVAIGISLAINVILDILLIPIFSYIGASISTLISYFFLMVISANFVRKQGITLDLIGTVSKTVGIGIIVCGVVFFNLSSDISTLILRSCVGISLYIVLLFTLQVITKKEIRIIKSMFLRKSRVSRSIDELDASS